LTALISKGFPDAHIAPSNKLLSKISKRDWVVKFRLIQEGMVQVMNNDGSFTGVVISKNPQGGYLIEGRGRRMKASDRGRLPTAEEITTHVETRNFASLQNTFGSIKRAFKVILQAPMPESGMLSPTNAAMTCWCISLLATSANVPNSKTSPLLS